eukprot:2848993-Pyramimonas_sp.AAC.1
MAFAMMSFRAQAHDRSQIPRWLHMSRPCLPRVCLSTSLALPSSPSSYFLPACALKSPVSTVVNFCCWASVWISVSTSYT